MSARLHRAPGISVSRIVVAAAGALVAAVFNLENATVRGGEWKRRRAPSGTELFVGELWW